MAFELRSIHAAPGIARLTIAAPDRQFHHGVLVRRPAQRHVGIPLVPQRRHMLAIAGLVVVRFGGVAAEPHIALRHAGGGIDQRIAAPVRTGQHTAHHLRAGLRKTRHIAFETHRASRTHRPPQHRLRAFHHHHAIKGFRRHIGHRIVHPRRTGAGHAAIVGKQIQARTEHAAQHRIAIAATAADRGKAGWFSITAPSLAGTGWRGSFGRFPATPSSGACAVTTMASSFGCPGVRIGFQMRSRLHRGPSRTSPARSPPVPPLSAPPPHPLQ